MRQFGDKHRQRGLIKIFLAGGADAHADTADPIGDARPAAKKFQDIARVARQAVGHVNQAQHFESRSRFRVAQVRQALLGDRFPFRAGRMGECKTIHGKLSTPSQLLLMALAKIAHSHARESLPEPRGGAENGCVVAATADHLNAER